MSSNIRVQRKCQNCGELFIAKTTVTQFCSDTCAKRAYKKRKQKEKVVESNIETSKELQLPFLTAQSKDFLEVTDVYTLMGLSKRTIYRLIKDKSLNALKIGNRYIVRRKDLDKMFEL